MKLNVAIKDFEGKDVKDQDGEVVTVYNLIIASLNVAQVKPEESHRKMKRFLIGDKMSRNADKDMTKILKAKDITEIMDAVKAVQAPIVVGRIAEIIDPNSLKEEDD